MTPWSAVIVTFLAGCSLALHTGKVPSALALLRAEFDLTLTATATIVSLYAMLIALLGAALGALVAHVGYRLFAIGGVALAGVASVLGAFAPSIQWLLLTRALEGAGWIVAVVSLPAIVARLATPADRPMALGLWGGFVPVGTGCMLLVAPAAQAVHGWRASWWLAGLLSLLAAWAVWRVCRQHRDALAGMTDGGSPRWADLRSPLMLVLAASFFCYSFQFLAVTAFLPSLLVEHDALPLPVAAAVVALIIMSNALGNLIGGRCLQRGMPLWCVLAGASTVSSLAASLAYLEAMPVPLRLVAALAFSVVGGAIPGSLFASVPRVASVSASQGPIVGSMMQAAGLGQLAGPLALAALVERSGSWSWVAGLCVPMGLAGLLLALWLRAFDARTPAT